MVTELEIIDTAIKVGLGALISGCTTYFVTARSHTDEMRKSMANNKKEFLKEIAINLEQSSSIANECNSAFYHLTSSSDTNKEEAFSHLLTKFVDAFNKAKTARTLCYLINEKSLGEIMERYGTRLAEEYMHYLEQRLQYDWEFVDAIGDKRVEIKNEILNRFGDIFESIYK